MLRKRAASLAIGNPFHHRSQTSHGRDVVAIIAGYVTDRVFDDIYDLAAFCVELLEIGLIPIGSRTDNSSLRSVEWKLDQGASTYSNGFSTPQVEQNLRSDGLPISLESTGICATERFSRFRVTPSRCGQFKTDVKQRRFIVYTEPESEHLNRPHFVGPRSHRGLLRLS
jgi:hypothetical protein